MFKKLNKVFRYLLPAVLIAVLAIPFMPTQPVLANPGQALYPLTEREITFKGVFPNLYSGNDEDHAVYGNTWAVQTFTPTDDFSTDRLWLYGDKVGASSKTIYIQLQTVDENNHPTGDILAYFEPSLNNFGSGSCTVVLSDTVNVAEGVTYAILVKFPEGDSENHWTWRQDGTSPPYTEGEACDSSDGGSSWTSDSTTDRLFKVKVLEWTTGWKTMDLSEWVPSGSTGVLLRIDCTTSTNRQIGVRKTGSVDDRYDSQRYETDTFAMIGIDGSQQMDIWSGISDAIQSSSINIYLQGYTDAGVTFHTNGQDISIATYDQWVTLDLSAECPNGTAAIIEMQTDSCDLWGIRPYASTDGSLRKDADGHGFAIVGLDSQQRCSGWAGHESHDWWVVGYFTEGIVTYPTLIDKTPSTTDSWQVIDISNDIEEGDVPVFSFWVVRGIGGGGTRNIMDVRKLGDTVDVVNGLSAIAWSSVEISDAAATFGQLEGYVGTQNGIGALKLIGYSTMDAPVVATTPNQPAVYNLMKVVVPILWVVIVISLLVVLVSAEMPLPIIVIVGAIMVLLGPAGIEILLGIMSEW